MSNSSRHSVSSGSPYEPRLDITRAVRIGSMKSRQMPISDKQDLFRGKHIESHEALKKQTK